MIKNIDKTDEKLTWVDIHKKSLYLPSIVIFLFVAKLQESFPHHIGILIALFIIGGLLIKLLASNK